MGVQPDASHSLPYMNSYEEETTLAAADNKELEKHNARVTNKAMAHKGGCTAVNGKPCRSIGLATAQKPKAFQGWRNLANNSTSPSRYSHRIG